MGRLLFLVSLMERTSYLFEPLYKNSQREVSFSILPHAPPLCVSNICKGKVILLMSRLVVGHYLGVVA